ncbi:NINE protein [Streptomyces mangrovisoli]|uniref:TM2 domain-containing protein n=1 Tax=Streptomyces mangrovisoli TaxID=1428628 RepID=A0A1J4NMP1_9ACTN|nr:TM2 domain-containing protein [Streptomyces mangrovisoli]OIJ63563.1 hypothetical protein WN71_032545 [Streptomyces mangrovisoli]
MSEQPQQPQPQQPQPGPYGTHPYGPDPGGYGYPQQPPGGYGYAQQPPGAYGYAQQPPGPYGYPGGPVPPGTYTGDPNAPYGYDRFGRPYSDKSKIVAGVLQLLLGGLGVGRFYIGNVGIGLAQLFTCGGFGIWALVDGIIMLTSDNQTDAQGRILRG